MEALFQRIGNRSAYHGATQGAALDHQCGLGQGSDLAQRRDAVLAATGNHELFFGADHQIEVP